MKFIFTLVILITLFLSGCGGKEEKEIVLDSIDLEEQMIEAYNKGIEALEGGDALFAAKKFQHCRKSISTINMGSKIYIDGSYSYYSQDYYGDAIFELNRFLKNYPENDNYAYAYFLLASCYYETIVDEKRFILYLEV